MNAMDRLNDEQIGAIVLVAHENWLAASLLKKALVLLLGHHRQHFQHIGYTFKTATLQRRVYLIKIKGPERSAAA